MADNADNGNYLADTHPLAYADLQRGARRFADPLSA